MRAEAFGNWPAPKLNEDSLSKKASEASGDASEVNLGILQDFIGYHLRMAQAAAFRVFAKETEQLDLKPGLFAILELIDENPGITQTALSRAYGRDKSSMTPILHQLVGTGLVQRRRVEMNKRAFSLLLTKDGKTTLRRLLAAANRHERRLNEVVGQEDAETLIRILQRLTAGLAEF